MKTVFTAAASALALLSLGGCATQSQIEQQTAQLTAVKVTLAHIQANQAHSLALQKSQVALLELANALLSEQMKAQSR